MSTIAELSDSELRILSDRGFALAFRLLGHREDAADAVQDALQQLFQSEKQFDDSRGSLSAWFLRITRNRAIDMQRKRRPLTADTALDPETRWSEAPDQRIHQFEVAREVQMALAELDKKSREVLVLRDFHDCSYAEIGEVLSIPAGTVMSRLHRARLTMAKKLSATIQENS